MNLCISPLEWITQGREVAVWMFWHHSLLEALDLFLTKTYGTSVYDLSTFVTKEMLPAFPPELQPTIVVQKAGDIVLVPVGSLHQVLVK